MERSAQLLLRLQQRDVTADEVREFCWLVHKPANDRLGAPMQDLNTFVTPESLVAFWWLIDWWDPYPEKPRTLLTPTLESYTFYCQSANGYTLQGAVERFYGDAVAYLQAEGVDITKPGESKRERSLRKHRDRMANARANRKVSDSKVPDSAREQVRALEAQRDTLKREWAKEDEELKDRVKQHQSAMEAAANTRKQAQIDHKAAVTAITAQIQELLGRS